MKVALLKVLISLILAAGSFRNDTYEEIQPEEQPELQLIRATCYCSTGNPTASGVMPYYGVIAGRQEDLGKIAILYTTEKEYIGIFEFRDTGGHQRLKDGTAIDVYLGELDRCYEWIDEYGDYVYIQIIEAEG